MDAARRAGLDVELRVDGDVEGVDAAAGEAAYRIAQESLTNVLRHSGAHAVTVHVDAREGIRLTVADDGTRTGDGDPAAGGGIRGMRERAEAAGGRLEAGPRPGGGWSVMLAVPRGRR